MGTDGEGLNESEITADVMSSGAIIDKYEHLPVIEGELKLQSNHGMTKHILSYLLSSLKSPSMHLVANEANHAQFKVPGGFGVIDKLIEQLGMSNSASYYGRYKPGHGVHIRYYSGLPSIRAKVVQGAFEDVGENPLSVTGTLLDLYVGQ